MFERYTEGARRVLFFARYEVSRLGSRSIEPEHLLLGLTREPHRGLAGQLFSRAHVSLQGVCTEIERGIVIGQRIPTSVEVPFSKPTKQILEWAASEADRLKSAAIDTEHLLLGILRNEQTRAASILMRLGMNLRTVREDVVELRNAETTSSETPQDSAVRIAPTRKRELGISSRGRPGSLELEGFTLRDVLAQVCGVHASRIELPSWVDHAARYDLSAAWPEDRLHQTGHDLIRGGIERHFGVTVAHEPQWLDVYVVTAPEGTSATGIDADNLGGGGIGSSGAEYMTTSPTAERPLLGSGAIITGLSASNATIEDFCHSLEEGLDRLVLDETNLKGRFDFQVHGHATTVEELREMLQAQLRLVLTPAQREVMMLVVRRR